MSIGCADALLNECFYAPGEDTERWIPGSFCLLSSVRCVYFMTIHVIMHLSLVSAVAREGTSRGVPFLLGDSQRDTLSLGDTPWELHTILLLLSCWAELMAAPSFPKEAEKGNLWSSDCMPENT